MTANIGDLRPDILALADKLRMQFTATTGKSVSFGPDGGVRSSEKQAQIYADSLRQGYRAAPPGNSWHEFGAAFDLVISGTGQDAAKDNANPLYKQLADIGRSLGLRAGYYFNTGKPDPYHFEANEMLSVIRTKWEALQRERRGQSGFTPVPIVSALAIIGLLLLAVRRWTT